MIWLFKYIYREVVNKSNTKQFVVSYLEPIIISDLEQVKFSMHNSSLCM